MPEQDSILLYSYNVVVHLAVREEVHEGEFEKKEGTLHQHLASFFYNTTCFFVARLREAHNEEFK